MAVRQRRQRRRRQTPEEGRRQLLEAGRDHLHENPLGAPLDHVRIADIVARLGLSIGAVYHYWETQDDYRDDLLELLLSPEQLPAVFHAGQAVGDAVAAAETFEELIRTSAEISFAGLAESADRERLTWALMAHDDPGINTRLGDQSAEVGRRWASLFVEYFPRYGLEPRPPFTHDSIAVVLMGMVQGLHIRRTIDPEVVGGELGDGWDLFAAAALAFLIGATRPTAARSDPAAGDRDVWALAKRAFPRRAPT